MRINEKKLPKISVIVPAKPGGKTDEVVNSLKKVDYPSERVEILLVYGFSPSGQRNRAIKKARGSILYFLDNDSEISKNAFKMAVAAFEGKKIGGYPKIRGFSFLPPFISRLVEKTFFSGNERKGKIAAVGGPNVWERKESFWSSMVGIILESFFGHWKMSSRYRPIGGFRRADEKELILCNMAIKKSVINDLGGFREELYPNEENEFLNRLSKAGFDCIYHPGIIVYRPRRENLSQILQAFFSYGRGRMEQIRIEGVWLNLPLLLPLFFLFYFISLLFFQNQFMFLPLILYFFLAFNSALGFAIRRKKLYLTILVPVLFLAGHLTYAVGLLNGLITNLRKKRKRIKKMRVKIVKIKNLKYNKDI